MLILGIETSCDDTSCAIVENGVTVLSNVVSSQIKIHKRYGGIVPELASRCHLENINFVLDEAIQNASGRGISEYGNKGIRKEETRRKMQNIDAVAVTVGPGLIGSLLIGTVTARAISSMLKVPLIGVNHIEGHIFANYLQRQGDGRSKPFPVYRLPSPAVDLGLRTSDFGHPFISLVVSGGHTDLILVKKFGQYKILGRTRDDAVGEVFDKIGKFLGLGYPGGPVIDKLARNGDQQKIKFPRPYMPDTWDFSFSGLKTAVINYVNRKHSIIQSHNRTSLILPNCHLPNRLIADLCASFQQSCVDVLVTKTILACKKFNIKRIVLGGGVSANSRLRNDFAKRCEEENIKLFVPPIDFCTDNAAMIASVGYFKFRECGNDKLINPSPNLELSNW